MTQFKWSYFALFVGGWIVLADFPAYDAFQRASQMTAAFGTADGVIVGKDCSNHGSRRYEFQADGRDYSSLADARSDGDCEALQVGEHFPAFHERANPANNTAEFPDRLLQDAKRNLYFSGATTLAFIAFGLLRRFVLKR